MKFYYVFYRDDEGIEMFKEFIIFSKALEFALNTFSGSSADGFRIDCSDESCTVSIPFTDEILDILAFVYK